MPRRDSPNVTEGSPPSRGDFVWPNPKIWMPIQKIGLPRSKKLEPRAQKSKLLEPDPNGWRIAQEFLRHALRRRD